MIDGEPDYLLAPKDPPDRTANNGISILLIGRRPIFEKHPKSREFFWIKSFFPCSKVQKVRPTKAKNFVGLFAMPIISVGVAFSQKSC